MRSRVCTWVYEKRVCTRAFAKQSLHLRFCEAECALEFMRSRVCTWLYAKQSLHHSLCEAERAVEVLRSRVCTRVFAKQSFHLSFCACEAKRLVWSKSEAVTGWCFVRNPLCSLTWNGQPNGLENDKRQPLMYTRYLGSSVANAPPNAIIF